MAVRELTGSFRSETKNGFPEANLASAPPAGSLYSIFERIVRIPVFRAGVHHGCLERAIVWLYNACSKRTLFPFSFNESRAERSLRMFKNIGGVESFVRPRDEKGLVHMLTLRAKDFESILQSYGARWEEIVTGENHVLAIVPPADFFATQPAWKEFKKNTLLQFGWKEQTLRFDSGCVDVIITSSDANLIPYRTWAPRCFLYCRSASGPFIIDRPRAGFYLGLKQDFCFFSSRGIWKSEGTPSEAAFYLDMEAVYEKLQSLNPYNPEQLWIGGFCGGTPVAAHLKKKLHASGVNFFAEQGFSNFERDFVAPKPLSRFLMPWFLRTLYSRDIPRQLVDRPLECNFNIDGLWRDLKQSQKGKIVLIHARHDELISPAVKELFAELAARVNKVVVRIYFTPPRGVNGHSADFFIDSQARTLFVKAVFS